MIIRPQLPAGTYVLLSSDAMTIRDVTNARQRTRLGKVVTSNTITLIPLNDSQHWLLAELNSVTCTITLHNSAGTYGQVNWKPILETWLRTHTTGPWRTTQADTLQQPGGTECGTHTLLNIMQHIPHMVRPDTSTIQWSSNLRTHLINTIAHITNPATVNDMGGPPTESDTTLADCTPAPVHSRPSTNAITTTRETEHTPAPPPPPSPPSQPTHHPTGEGRGRRPHRTRMAAHGALEDTR